MERDHLPPLRDVPEEVKTLTCFFTSLLDTMSSVQ